MRATVTNSRIAEILRAARDRMNHGGKHWIQGAEQGRLGDYRDGIDENDPLFHELGYCSIGSIKEETGTSRAEYEAALTELARSIDSESVQDYKDTYSDPEDFMNVISDMIAERNDHYETGWSDVRSWFTRAARRASQRKD